MAAKPAVALEQARANVYKSMELTPEREILEQEVVSQAAALHGSEFGERYAAWRGRILDRRA